MRRLKVVVSRGFKEKYWSEEKLAQVDAYWDRVRADNAAYSFAQQINAEVREEARREVDAVARPQIDLTHTPRNWEGFAAMLRAGGFK